MFAGRTAALRSFIHALVVFFFLSAVAVANKPQAKVSNKNWVDVSNLFYFLFFSVFFCIDTITYNKAEEETKYVNSA
jgi:hypothetical protein